VLPDFLEGTDVKNDQEVLLGQDDLPSGTSLLLKGLETELKEIDRNYDLGTELTEKLAERKIRLSQHRFARGVLANCDYTCVFCGFKPSSLPPHSGLLRASHIKPWAVSSNKERVDVRNGLAACPTHDAAFDQGYLSVNGGYLIHKAKILQISIATDTGVKLYFGDNLSPSLILPKTGQFPLPQYLTYHRDNIFRK